MYFAFIPKSEALALLEEAEREAEYRGEFLAEQGSSYFHGGMSSADASFLASQDLAQRRIDFEQSEEGERYLARLQAARLYEGVLAARVHEWDIPEFVDGKPSYAHDPFTMLYGRESGRKFSPHHNDEDIPF